MEPTTPPTTTETDDRPDARANPMPSGSLELPQMPVPAYDFLLYLAERRQRKETAMYNGYTESDEKVKARFERRNRLHDEIVKSKQEAEQAIPVELPVLVAESAAS